MLVAKDTLSRLPEFQHKIKESASTTDPLFSFFFVYLPRGRRPGAATACAIVEIFGWIPQPWR